MWRRIVTPRANRTGRTQVGAITVLLATALLLPVPSSALDPANENGPELAQASTGEARLDDILTRAKKSGLNPDDLIRLCDEARQRNLTDADAFALADAVTRMAEADLPWRPVYDRVRQGLVKNAPPDRIAAVVMNMERKLRVGAALVDGSLEEAAALRGAPPTDPGSRSRLTLIDQTTFAIEKGVPETSIAAIFSELKTSAAAPADVLQSMQSPIVALTSLAAEGVPPAQGLKFVTEAFRNGCRDRDLEILAVAVGHVPPGERDRVARYIRDQLHRGKPPQEIFRDIHRRFPGRIPDRIRDRLRDGRPGPGSDARPPDDPGGRRRGRGNGGGTGGHP